MRGTVNRLKSGKLHKINLSVAYESTFEVELRLPKGKSLSDISELWVEWDDLCFTIGNREYFQRVHSLSPIFSFKSPAKMAPYNESWRIKNDWNKD